MGKPPRALRGRVHGHVAGPAACAVAALAWLRLSWWHPHLTYHFGPPLAAVAWPVVLRARLSHPASRAQSLAGAAGGFVVAMAALGAAIAVLWLQEPTLIGRGSVPVEEVVLAVCAGAWGWPVLRGAGGHGSCPAEPGQ
jgi:hypothetical protein